jgi:cysteine desulfurase
MDHGATTPCDPSVFDAMLPYFMELYGNAHSRNHKYGWDADSAVEHAREQVASVIGATPKSIVFTSGATESNNLAIKGCAQFLRASSGKDHLITTRIEHKCVLESFAELERKGFSVTYLPVKRDGLLDIDVLKGAITERTGLVSVIAVHNEIGVVQSLQEIGEVCKEHQVYFHTDAAQAIGKIPVDVDKIGADLMSISAHKVYGPKGVGALYARTNNQAKGRLRVYPLFSGGGQERGLRSGTLPVPLCVALGKAMELAESLRESECAQYQKYFDYFVDYILERLDNTYLNGSRTQRVPHNINMSFRFVEGESLMGKVPYLAVSSGSACTSSSLEPSYVLKELGVSDELAHTSIRFGLGRATTMDDVERVAADIVKYVRELREMSPLYEMHRDGIDIDAIEWAEH